MPSKGPARSGFVQPCASQRRSGAMLGGLWLAIGQRRGSAWPVTIGMMGSLLGMIAIAVWAKSWVAWPWFTLIGTVLTLGLAELVRLFWGEDGRSLQRSDD